MNGCVTAYLVPPGATSQSICHAQDGCTSVSRCGRFLPGWTRTERRPFRLCRYCRRAVERLERTAAAAESRSKA